MPFTTDTTLTGRHVRLVPLQADHHDDLVEAVRDGELWKLWYTAIPAPETMAAEIQRRLGLQKAGSMLPFAVLDPSGMAVGMTTYMNIDAATPRVEIGSTWNAASAQGSGTNADSKLLLLQHAFEVWGCSAVEFRTDFHNHRSREAIARLGAKQDGVLRAHLRPAAGYVRDTVVFSITQPEWPGVRLGLEHRIARHLVEGGDSPAAPSLG